MKHALLCLLLALASCTCDEWKATPAAAARRMGAARLQLCIADRPCGSKPQCVLEVRAWCLDAGAEKTCGEGEPEDMPCGTGRLVPTSTGGR